MIYLDHAATSWPKPAEVVVAMSDYLESAGGNPGRAGHTLSVAAGRIVYDTRELVADYFNAPDPMRVVFTHNATHALNIALFGIVRPGDTVVTTSVEHNSVIRPLRALEMEGATLKIIPCDREGTIDMDAYSRAISGNVRMVVFTHASNVIGQLTPTDELVRLARSGGALTLMDAAQTAGVVPIDVRSLGVDLLAFTGHKGLQGPPGTGGLIIGERVDADDMRPLLHGGTGSSSESENQPCMLPDRLESGTPNGVGLAGLGAGIRWIASKGVSSIAEHHQYLASILVQGLQSIPGVQVYGPSRSNGRVGIVSFRLDGMTVSDVGRRLDADYRILCRVGLHCAPAAHRTLGTFPEGTVRLSLGPMTTEDDVRTAVSAIEEISRR